MIKLDNIAEQLFNKIRGRFPKVTIGDSEGNITNEPPLARYFDFDYTIGEDTSLGNVSISLDEEEGLVIMFSKDFVEGSYGSTKDDWYNFLKEMRQFAKKRLMKFEVRDINRSNLTRRDYQYLATNRPGDKPMSESKMYGTNKTSFQKIGKAKLSIKHTQPINTENTNSRTGKIGSIFIESPDGEKFKYPFKHLSGARALARHVAEGGHAYDDFGKYISSLSEEMSKLRKFGTYMNRSAVMAETLDEYTGIVKERVNTIKKEIQNLQKESYYKTAVENFSPRVVEDVPTDIQAAWVDQLTIKQFNEELKDVFPYIYNLVGENTVKEINLEDLIKESANEAYTIRKGDTVYSISKQFNVPVEDIIEVNGLDDRATIYPGQRLILPGVNNPDSFNIGAGGTSEIAPNGQATGSTRGVNPARAVETAIESLMGQFAEAKECDDCGCSPCECDQTDEGNAFSKALAKARANNDDEMEVDGKKIPVTEFILSYFDRHTGQFPKGETAVLTMVEKEYGEQYIRPAQAFIEQVNNKVAEVMGYRDNELEEDNIGEGFLKNLVGDVRNAFKPGVQVTPNMVKELEAGVAAIKAGGQPTPRQQKIFDRFMSDTLPRELQKMGIPMESQQTNREPVELNRIKGLAGL